MMRCADKAEERYISRFLGRRLSALFEEDGGYTENYIRVYSENAKEGTMYEVKLIKPVKGGAIAEIVKEI